MYYVMSDIHGDYRNFRRMLAKIKFSSNDRLYILGDAIDKGKQNLRVIDIIQKNRTIQLMKGNHEYFCERYLAGIVSGAFWDSCGGKTTRMEVEQLTEGEKKALFLYLKELPTYEIVTVNEKEYFLTHSGYHADYEEIDPNTGKVDIQASVEQAVNADMERYLFSNDIHYLPASVEFDKRVIVGHYPTVFLDGYKKAKIYYGKRYIDIDTGNENRKNGGKLSCLRLDDGKEYYI